MQLLSAQYMPKSKLYMIMPVMPNNAPPDKIYLFTEFLEAKKFIDDWYLSPGYATFSYHTIKAYRTARNAPRFKSNVLPFKGNSHEPSFN